MGTANRSGIRLQTMATVIGALPIDRDYLCVFASHQTHCRDAYRRGQGEFDALQQFTVIDRSTIAIY
jgi:hypothetical protein